MNDTMKAGPFDIKKGDLEPVWEDVTSQLILGAFPRGSKPREMYIPGFRCLSAFECRNPDCNEVLHITVKVYTPAEKLIALGNMENTEAIDFLIYNARKQRGENV